MVAIIDYGLGNLGSIYNMLKKIGETEIFITSNKVDISMADKIILPGVGSFDSGINNLKELDLIDLLTEEVFIKGKNFLGICLGMQLLFTSSEEGSELGLNWIKGNVNKFTPSTKYRVPNMGWNYVEKKKDCLLFNNLELNSKFYFVHSFYVKCEDPDNVCGVSSYGIEFDAVVNKNNIWGVQFHPEKSHRFGKQLLRNFLANN